MIYDTDIIIKTDSGIKHESQEIFDALGLDMGAAVNIFLRQVIIHHGLPFRVILEPSRTTINAMNSEEYCGPFDSVEALMKDLND